MNRSVMIIKKESKKKTDSADYEAAAVLVIDGEGRILCAERSDGKGICGPGGHIEEGETPEEAALREAYEEFHITPLNILPYGELDGSTGLHHSTKLYFTDDFTGTPEADGDEMLEARWMTIQELRQEKLHPAFEAGLDIFQDIIREKLTFVQKYVTINMRNIDGGQGSGNFGHSGRPGNVGGSSGNSGKSSEKGSGEKSNGGAEGGSGDTGSSVSSAKEPEAKTTPGKQTNEPENRKKPSFAKAKFERKEDTIEVTEDVKVKFGNGVAMLNAGTVISTVTDFAGKGQKRAIDVEEKLVGSYPETSVGEWVKSKGVAKVALSGGKEKNAELHWFEHPDIGQVSIKVKRIIREKKGE